MNIPCWNKVHKQTNKQTNHDWPKARWRLCVFTAIQAKTWKFFLNWHFHNREWHWQRQRHKDLIGWIGRKNNRAARTARFLVQVLNEVCETRAWNFHIWRSQADDNANPYMKTIRAKPAKMHFAYFVKRDQYGIIAKPLQQPTKFSIYSPALKFA